MKSNKIFNRLSKKAGLQIMAVIIVKIFFNPITACPLASPSLMTMGVTSTPVLKDTYISDGISNITSIQVYSYARDPTYLYSIQVSTTSGPLGT